MIDGVGRLVVLGLPRLALLCPCDHAEPVNELETMGKSSKKKSESEPPNTSFEGSVRRLGEIVERLEAGELPLEESIQLFEEGVRLARLSQKQLDFAERRVEELLSVDEEGNPIVREMAADGS